MKRVFDSVKLRQNMSNFVFVFLALTALFIVLSTVYTSFNYLFPSLFLDQWEYMGSYIAYDSVGQLHHWLLAHHNEHQIILPRLLFLIDWKLFGGQNYFLIFWIVLNQALLAFFLFRILNSILDLSRQLKYGVLCILLVFLFSATQLENFTWGFQVQFVNVFFFALLSIYFACKFLENSHWIDYLGMLFFAVLAGFSMANGLLVWPIVILLFLIYRRRFWSTTGLYTVSIGVVILYLGAIRGAGETSLSIVDKINEPFGVLGFFLVYLGNPIGKVSYTLAILWALVLLALFVFCVIWAIRQKYKPHQHGLILLGCLFIIMTAFMTALGRMEEGLVSATAQRYNTPVLILNILLLIMVLKIALHEANMRRMQMIARGGLASFALMGAYLVAWQMSYISNYIGDYRERLVSLNALQNDNYDMYYAEALHPRMLHHAMTTFRVMEKDPILAELHNYKAPDLSELPFIESNSLSEAKGYILRNDSVGMDATTWIVCGTVAIDHWGENRFLHIRDSMGQWAGSAYLLTELAQKWPLSAIPKSPDEIYFYGHIGFTHRDERYQLYLETDKGLLQLADLSIPTVTPQFHGIVNYAHQRPVFEWIQTNDQWSPIEHLSEDLAYPTVKSGFTTWSENTEYTGAIGLTLAIPEGASVLQIPYRSGSMNPNLTVQIQINDQDEIYKEFSIPKQAEAWVLFDVEVPKDAQNIQLRFSEQGQAMEQWVALGDPAWW